MGGDNLLLMRPIGKQNVTTDVIDGQVKLVVHHNRWINRFLTKYFNVPAQTYIALDSQGAYVWEHCNGQYTVSDILEAMKNRFGAEAEPALERLVTFIQILARNRLVALGRQ